MTFRANQPGSVLASLSAFWKQSMQKNRAMDLNSTFFGTTLSISAPTFELSLFFLSIDTLDADNSGGPRFCLYQAATAPTSIATAWRSSSLIRTTTNQNVLQIDI